MSLPTSLASVIFRLYESRTYVTKGLLNDVFKHEHKLRDGGLK